MKTYTSHVQFKVISLSVKAKNAREAKVKIRAKVSKLKADRLIDPGHFFVDAK